MTTAKDIAQKIRMMQIDDLGNALVRVGISVVSYVTATQVPLLSP